MRAVSAVLSGVVSLCLLASPILAQSGRTLNSVEEKQVSDVAQYCKQDQSGYGAFDCQCITDAFRQARVEAGPEVIFADVYDSVRRSPPVSCVDLAQYRVNQFKSCFRTNKKMRGDDAEPFCECVADKSAAQMEATPSTIPAIKSGWLANSMLQCAEIYPL